MLLSARSLVCCNGFFQMESELNVKFALHFSALLIEPRRLDRASSVI